MAGLGETVAGLARLRKAMKSQSSGGDDAGMTELRGFGFNPGALRALAYVPENLPADAALVVVLHGCTQWAGPYARGAGWLALADRHGFAVLAPEQDGANNPNRCFNWFEPGDAARGVGEAASIHAMVEHMVETHKLDPARVFVTGLSAGGAMTAVMMATYPETFAAGGVVAGLAYGVAGNVQQALGAMKTAGRLERDQLAARVTDAAPAPVRWPRLSIWHGRADATVGNVNAQALVQQWTAVHGLAERPTIMQARGGWTRSTWHDADGRAVVECNLLAGVGHGAPLATLGDDPIGEAGPFMLEAGVSSALEIARFWELAPPEAEADANLWLAAARKPADQPPPRDGLGEGIMDSVSPHVSHDIQQVIRKALKSAGLMR